MRCKTNYFQKFQNMYIIIMTAQQHFSYNSEKLIKNILQKAYFHSTALFNLF